MPSILKDISEARDYSRITVSVSMVLRELLQEFGKYGRSLPLLTTGGTDEQLLAGLIITHTVPAISRSDRRQIIMMMFLE
jgi:hypothetical protein